MIVLQNSPLCTVDSVCRFINGRVLFSGFCRTKIRVRTSYWYFILCFDLTCAPTGSTRAQVTERSKRNHRKTSDLWLVVGLNSEHVAHMSLTTLFFFFFKATWHPPLLCPRPTPPSAWPYSESWVMLTGVQTSSTPPSASPPLWPWCCWGPVETRPHRCPRYAAPPLLLWGKAATSRAAGPTRFGWKQVESGGIFLACCQGDATPQDIMNAGQSWLRCGYLHISGRTCRLKGERPDSPHTLPVRADGSKVHDGWGSLTRLVLMVCSQRSTLHEVFSFQWVCDSGCDCSS